MKNLTNIKLHGILGDFVGENWNLKVKSVAEAIRAIEILSNKKLYKFLKNKDDEGVRYKVLINGRQADVSNLTLNNLEGIRDSELSIENKELKSIDIVPVIQGAGKAGSVGAIILGVILVVVGILLLGYSGGSSAALIGIGIGLIVGGVMYLLANPPKIDDFREVKGGGRTSYLFSGPQNTSKEGGPVPVGYGRMIVGSQVISASYEVSHVNADFNPLTS